MGLAVLTSDEAGIGVSICLLFIVVREPGDSRLTHDLPR